MWHCKKVSVVQGESYPTFPIGKKVSPVKKRKYIKVFSSWVWLLRRWLFLMVWLTSLFDLFFLKPWTSCYLNICLSNFVPCTLFENYSKCRIWFFLNLAFSTKFCPIKTGLSGNTVWPQASGFQKLAKMDHFVAFLSNFGHSKCKRSSLRSQFWMRLFLWFSNTVPCFFFFRILWVIRYLEN